MRGLEYEAASAYDPGVTPTSFGLPGDRPMRQFRFTIAGLLGLILFAAIGVALRSSSEAWDSAVFGATLAILVGSLVMTCGRRGRSRAFWSGFAIVGWLYLAAILVPPIAGRLPTTKGLAALDAMRPRADPSDLAYMEYDEDGAADIVFANTMTYRRADGKTYRRTFVANPPTVAVATPAAGGPAPTSTTQRPSWSFLAGRPGTSREFVNIGHTLFALILAFLGAHASRSLYDREMIAATPTGGPA